MNRRRFLLGTSAIAAAAIMPVVQTLPVYVGMDLASSPGHTALWIIESTPSGYSHFYSLFIEQQIANKVFAEKNDVFKLYENDFLLA